MNPFQSINTSKPLSSKFDLTHTRKFSFEPGKLTPILCAEALPGEVWDYDMNAVVRMMPMLAPIMHMVDVCCHGFFYPERLTQRRNMFEIFITGGKNGDGKDAQGNTIEAPYINVKGQGDTFPAAVSIANHMTQGTLADFLGFQFSATVQLGTDDVQRINARPFLAFWRIYCEYFRDQNLTPNWVDAYPSIFDAVGGDLTPAIVGAMNDGLNPFPFFDLPRVCWEKDYFTSALPFAQRGEAVEAPLQGSATIRYKDTTDIWPSTASNPPVPGEGFGVGGPISLIPTNVNNPAFIRTDGTSDPASTPLRMENIDEVTLNAGGFTISALRTAARLQEWLEKMATGGARYIEQIKVQFGVTSRDARLQRAEYLGGGKIPMHINEVIQTSADDGTPLAEMAGHGVTAGQVTSFRKFTEEHGYFMVFLFLRPKTSYSQGLHRMWWNRFDKLDYAWPSFARIGEQEVLRKEVYYSCNNNEDEDVFGYQQRFGEYKYIPSTVHGEFRTNLDFWHWGRVFDTAPSLNSQFVECDPSNRIFNVLTAGSDQLYCIVKNNITARRPLPYYGEPTL